MKPRDRDRPKSQTLALVQSADGGVLSRQIGSSSRSVWDEIRHLKIRGKIH